MSSLVFLALVSFPFCLRSLRRFARWIDQMEDDRDEVAGVVVLPIPRR
jgi:hypothetical protein